MSGRTKILFSLFGAGSLAGAVLVGLAMHAVRQVQPFYTAAIEINADTLADESHAMERRVAALVSDVVAVPRWQAVFSDLEVNGWLAVALKEKFADLLPESIVDPRVAFFRNEAVVGFRLVSEDFSAVISVRVEAWVSESDLLAVRLLKAHAGTLPIPLSTIVEHMSQGARTLQLPLRWTQEEGFPVALISLPDVLSTSEESRRLEAVELHEGELYVVGSTWLLEPSLSAPRFAEKEKSEREKLR